MYRENALIKNPFARELLQQTFATCSDSPCCIVLSSELELSNFGRYRITESLRLEETLKMIKSNHNLNLALNHGSKNLDYTTFKHLLG